MSLLERGNGDIDLVSLLPVAVPSLLDGGRGDIDLVSLLPVDLLPELSLLFLGTFSDSPEPKEALLMGRRR